ncbi:MAG: glycosyltransferase family 39 protein, partial [Armatimonadota bacterium]|nr:glycosyltransferase family 39 protein [Armatimonadota bacterium]
MMRQSHKSTTSLWWSLFKSDGPGLPVAIAAAFGLCFAVVLPAYSGPDEIGHVAYVAALAQGHLPLAPSQAIADIHTGTTWQAQHPPLFYLLATPFYLACGQNPTIGLYVLRCLCVAALMVTVWMVHRLATQLLPAPAARPAALFAATHPVLVYVSAMANNEALAVTLAVACVWAATQAHPAPQSRRWLLLTAALGGLGLLTKLTAIAGVIAAAAIVGQGQPLRKRVARATLVLAGAIAFWLPWGLWMYHLHGAFIPSPIQRPTFVGGLGALFLYPGDALRVAGITAAEFFIGFIAPYWLSQSRYLYYYVMGGCGFDCLVHSYLFLGCGWLLAALAFWRAWTHRPLRFFPLCIFSLYGLV